ncbi:MAG: phosphoglucomutase/phosphomannomutase family protein, partial [Acidobacteriota bacterium]|nr:phosphoglucomutase/phosphomannomutase family protein [Acidobacteriota bacterium]
MSKPKQATPIRFGTDGWRAVIAQDYTFANLERVAQAYARHVLNEHESSRATKTREPQAKSTDGPRVVVGYDRRFMSENFAARAAEVLAGNRIAVEMFDADVPTPLVSWSVRDRKAAGGVVITASHNPAEFNGFKIKAACGGSATPETTRAVESLIDSETPARAELRAGSRSKLEPSVASYREQIASYVDLERLRAARGRVVVDPIHGAGGRWVESFLKGGALEVETIRADRDPRFGGV